MPRGVHAAGEREQPAPLQAQADLPRAEPRAQQLGPGDDAVLGGGERRDAGVGTVVIEKCTHHVH